MAIPLIVSGVGIVGTAYEAYHLCEVYETQGAEAAVLELVKLGVFLVVGGQVVKYTLKGGAAIYPTAELAWQAAVDRSPVLFKAGGYVSTLLGKAKAGIVQADAFLAEAGGQVVAGAKKAFPGKSGAAVTESMPPQPSVKDKVAMFETQAAAAGAPKPMAKSVALGGSVRDRAKAFENTESTVQLNQRYSREKQALVDMAKKDKRTGVTQADMDAYKALNKELKDPFLDRDIRGLERHKKRPYKEWHGHVGPVDHMPKKK